MFRTFKHYSLETRPTLLLISTVAHMASKHFLSTQTLHTGHYHLGTLILRCLHGSNTVSTTLLARLSLTSALDTETLHRGLVRPRRPGADGTLCLLPLVFHRDGISGFRWDSLFLVPMNEAAHRVAMAITSHNWEVTQSLTLTDCGDTLIVDNWRFLHGRNRIPVPDMNRTIERVYLSGIHR